jgi:hypothetical protein
MYPLETCDGGLWGEVGWSIRANNMANQGQISTMNTSIEAYRAAIGNWHGLCMARKIKVTKIPLTPIKIKLLLCLILSSHGIFIGALLLLRCGDVHPNPGPTHTNKPLNICHINAESLYLTTESPNQRRKITEIETGLINSLKIDIICISETWLNNTIDTTDVDIEGYKFYRKDRGVIRRGGVGMYVNDSIPNHRALEFEFPEIELLWVEIELGIKKMIIGACYRPRGNLWTKSKYLCHDFKIALD